MLIRGATPADLSAILQLERTADAAAHWSEAEYQNIFEAVEPRHLVLVAGDIGVQAFLVARVLHPEWELENIVVAEPIRRRSVATRLIRELQEQARTQKAQAIFLEVRQCNAAARSLYESCGFGQVGRRPAYYEDPKEDAVIYKFYFK
jgi:ribosomal-protein-alanine N-acetyltransferase